MPSAVLQVLQKLSSQRCEKVSSCNAHATGHYRAHRRSEQRRRVTTHSARSHTHTRGLVIYRPSGRAGAPTPTPRPPPTPLPGRRRPRNKNNNVVVVVAAQALVARFGADCPNEVRGGVPS